MSQSNNKVKKYRNNNSNITNGGNTTTHNYPSNNLSINNSPKEIKKVGGGRGQEQTKGYGRERKPPNTKKGTPANHLLNYSVNVVKPLPYSSSPSSSSFSTKQSWAQKERFLQANFQFTVHPDALNAVQVTADYLAQWYQIKQVILSSIEECNCPICLEHPIAPKITKCGHIFCWPCLLHYFNATFVTSSPKLSHSSGNIPSPSPNHQEKLRRSAELVRTIGDLEVDQMYKKCPFCSELFSLAEIKSVHILHKNKYQEGDTLEMVLLKRNKYSTIPIPTDQWKQKLDFRFPPLSSSSSPSTSLFSRFHIEENESTNKAGYTDLEISILLREKDQLQSALLHTSSNDTDKIFLDLALLQIQVIQDRIASLTSSSSPSDSLSSSLDASQPINEKAVGDNKEKKAERVMDPNAPAFIPSFFTPSSSDPSLDNNNNNNEGDNNSNRSTVNNSNNNNNKGRGEEGDYVYFYQEKSGLKFYLHPICSKALVIEHGSYNNFPSRLSAKILQIEEITINDYIRKRYKFLSHLPLSTICYFCEVEMKGLVSGKTLKAMGSVFKERKMNRQRQAMEKQRDASLSTPLFPKPSIDWNNSPPLLPLSFDPSSNIINLNDNDHNNNNINAEDGCEDGSGEVEGEMRAPQWVTSGSSLSLEKLKSSPLRVSPSYPLYSAPPINKKVIIGEDGEEEEIAPDYAQSFCDSISSLPLPSLSTPSKKKKKQNKVLFFDTSQKRKY